MNNPTVKAILYQYLKDHGYDGLYNVECGCKVDDLNPCGALSEDCQAGYLIKCDCEECTELGYHIGPDKVTP